MILSGIRLDKHYLCGESREIFLQWYEDDASYNECHSLFIGPGGVQDDQIRYVLLPLAWYGCQNSGDKVVGQFTPSTSRPRGWVSGPSPPPPQCHTPMSYHRYLLPQLLLQQPPPLQALATLLYRQKYGLWICTGREAWCRRKGNHYHHRHRRSKSVTDKDLDELKACIELGFEFDSPEMDPQLFHTLLTLGLYYPLNWQCHGCSLKSSLSSSPFSSTASDCDTLSSLGSPQTIYSPGDNPQTLKTRLRQ